MFVISVTTKIMKKISEIPHRLESIDTQWDLEHPKCAHLLRNACWFMVFRNITGFNAEVSTNFARKFMGTRVDFRSIIFKVS